MSNKTPISEADLVEVESFLHDVERGDAELVEVENILIQRVPSLVLRIRELEKLLSQQGSQ